MRKIGVSSIFSVVCRPLSTRPLAIALAVACCHFALQVLALMSSISSTMARFDSGAAPTPTERAVDLLAWIVNLPLVTLATRLPIGPTGAFGWLILLANSAVWGLAAWVLAREIKKVRTR
jgi:hypothetical protein